MNVQQLVVDLWMAVWWKQQRVGRIGIAWVRRYAGWTSKSSVGSGAVSRTGRLPGEVHKLRNLQEPNERHLIRLQPRGRLNKPVELDIGVDVSVNNTHWITFGEYADRVLLTTEVPPINFY